MRYIVMGFIFCSAGVVAGKGITKGDLQDEKSRLSYAIGVRTAQNLVRQKISLNAEAFLAGVEHALQGGGNILLANKEIEDLLRKFQQQQERERRKGMEEIGTRNKKAGEDFLAANEKKEGVVALESGLQYKILVKGTGRKPKKSDTVVTHYVGTLIDGKVFDSSRKRGRPATFPVSGVIPGWVEALQLMPVGSKWMLYVPPSLAYGVRGTGRDIGPNSTLIFEVELIEIK